MMDNPLRVLVVDDQAPVLRFLTAALAGRQCETLAASTAEQALELLARHPFDLVISDIRMPGLSGLDLLRAVKTRQPETPVVLITGAPSVDSAVYGLRYGAYDYLAKPFTAADVRALVDRVRGLRRSGHAAGPARAGLAEELARRQQSLELLCRLGALAMGASEADALVERVLRDGRLSLDADAAVVVRRNGRGFRAARDGDGELARWLLARLDADLDGLMAGPAADGADLHRPGDTVRALVAVIPGAEQAHGVLCVARRARDTGFLPEERDLLVGFARHLGLALERLRLGAAFERHLVNTITAFVTAIEAKDPYLKGHSARVAEYAGAVAAAMGLDGEQIALARRGGILHDLGKLGVLEPILDKPGPLTPEEYGLIQAHPEVGYRILQPLGFLERESLAVRHHHERWDGCGYPAGLAGEDIPLVARIVTVADAFDAMTSHRPYRAALDLNVALGEIERGAGTQFDPAVAAAFLTVPRARLRAISELWSGAPSPEVAHVLVP